MKTLNKIVISIAICIPVLAQAGSSTTSDNLNPFNSARTTVLKGSSNLSETMSEETGACFIYVGGRLIKIC